MSAVTSAPSLPGSVVRAPLVTVSDAVATFQPVRGRFFCWLLRLLPWLMLVVPVAVLTGRLTVSGAPMFLSGWVIAAAALLAFDVLMWRIPWTLGALWNRSLIAGTSTTPAAAAAPLEGQYAAFIQNIESWLNHPGQCAMGIGFAVLVVTWYQVRFSPTYTGLLTIAEFGGECLVGFTIGLMAWRMGVVGWKVWQLGRCFDVTPLLQHPDGCGGLEPLGQLCLSNALIVSMAGLFLGGWIVVGPVTPYHALAAAYAPLFTKLLIIPLAFAGISFFWPLWSVHEIMVAKRALVRQRLDALGNSINDVARELLACAGDTDPARAADLAKRLDLMQQTYASEQRVPVWPFNTSILTKLLTAQAVPLLGLTGIGEPVLKEIQALVGLLGQVQQP